MKEGMLQGRGGGGDYMAMGAQKEQSSSNSSFSSTELFNIAVYCESSLHTMQETATNIWYKYGEAEKKIQSKNTSLQFGISLTCSILIVIR